MNDFVSLKEAARIVGVSAYKLRKLAETGIIPGEMGAWGCPGKFLLGDVQKAVQSNYLKCDICGTMFWNKGNKKRCSETCTDKANRDYSKWSRERKEKHRRQVAEWRAKNPEKAKEMDRRAMRKYYLKMHPPKD